MLRKFPFHPIFGDGDYQVQPIFVDDLAALAVELGHSRENVALDAVGPEVHTYREMVSLILDKIGANSRLIRVNPKVALIVSRIMGVILRDVLLTRDEIDGSMSSRVVSDLLVSKSGELAPGSTLFSDWLTENAHLLGQGYASELDRHYR